MLKGSATFFYQILLFSTTISTWWVNLHHHDYPKTYILLQGWFQRASMVCWKAVQLSFHDILLFSTTISTWWINLHYQIIIYFIAEVDRVFFPWLSMVCWKTVQLCLDSMSCEVTFFTYFLFSTFGVCWASVILFLPSLNLPLPSSSTTSRKLLS